MNNQQQQIIDEAYERYSKEYEKDSSIGFRLRHKDKNGNPTYGKGNKEMFINKCKTNTEFSKKWGLQIYTKVDGDKVWMGMVYNDNAVEIRLK